MPDDRGLEDAVVVSVFGAWGESRTVTVESVRKFWDGRAVDEAMARRAVARAMVAVEPGDPEYPGRAQQEAV